MKRIGKLGASEERIRRERDDDERGNKEKQARLCNDVFKEMRGRKGEGAK